MPNSVSAKKRIAKASSVGPAIGAAKSAIKSQVRKVREAIAAGNVEAPRPSSAWPPSGSTRPAATGIVHANLAARVKSRLSAAIKAAKQKK